MRSAPPGSPCGIIPRGPLRAPTRPLVGSPGGAGRPSVAQADALPDGEHEESRPEGQQPGGRKRHVVGPEPDPQEPAAVGREGRADRCPKNTQPNRIGPGVNPRGQTPGQWSGDRGDRVEAIDHARERQFRQITP